MSDPAFPSVLRRLVVAAAAGVALVTLDVSAAHPVLPAGERPSVSESATSTPTQARPSDRTRASWNSHVQCRATVATLRQVLGKIRNSRGGAARRGGQFNPGIPDKRALRPPCRREGVPTFVQLNRVHVGPCSKINDDGDWTCTLTDPTTPARRPDDMKSIHVETDEKFRRRSGWSIPPANTDIDVQGFVYWDPGHTAAAWHNHSGWELHSFTAWRRS